MFTQKFLNELEAPFTEQIRRMGKQGESVSAMLAACDRQKGEALKCLYASMPLCDALDYPPALFDAFAEHGVFLWERGPFAGRVPEKLFAGYVLCHRVNDEALSAHRRFFYEQTCNRIRGMSMQETVLAVNYWCASRVAYRETDGRTAGPMCVYRSAFGRCGEESVFTVSVLRSLGIPARQVYVPLWSHCDDNHAWVEAWCDGEWVFLGACEPEERVNKGWFTKAASRAMLVHSRWLMPVEPPEGSRIASEGRGMFCSLNHLDRYGRTAELKVSVRDRTGKPAVGARVCFQVMNGAGFGEIASMRTDREGLCALLTGKGTILVSAWRDGLYGECLVDVKETDSCRILLDSLPDIPAEDARWEGLVIRAPEAAPVDRCILTEEELCLGREKRAAALGERREREEGFFDPEAAERAMRGMEGEDRRRCLEILRAARGNQRELVEFLMGAGKEEWPVRWKLRLLCSLTEKDWRDVTADTLADICAWTDCREDVWGEDIFTSCVLCPRVGNETLRPHRGYLRSWLERENVRESVGRLAGEEGYCKTAGEMLRKNPALAWKLVCGRILSDRQTEYGKLVTSPQGALESGYGSELTRRTVCVQLLRTLGIPARLDPAEGLPEVWKEEKDTSGREGHFVLLQEEEKRTGRLCITGRPGEDQSYGVNWTLARFAEEGWKTLLLQKEQSQGIFSVFPGKYRLLTANRLPGGNILVGRLVFDLKDGEEREIQRRLVPSALSDMWMSCDIPDFSLRREDGTAVRLSLLTRKRGGLFIWLEEDAEPSFHILNEIWRRRKDYALLPTELYFVVARPESRRHPMLARVLSALGTSRLLLDDSEADMEALARSMYLEPGRLPLAVIIDSSMTGIYGMAGYHVGAGDMLLRLLRYRNAEKT